MKWLINWGVKKYVLEIVNKALAAYNVNIDRARAIIRSYTSKVAALLRFLNSLDAKLADHKLTEAEAVAITNEAVALSKELTA